jgi:branched-chain amino acid transport system substrate-binding protein
MRLALAGMAIGLGLVLSAAAMAQQSASGGNDRVRIGVLTDMAGPFSDISGPGAVEAVKIAVEDFGGKVLGKPIDVLVADHQNKADVGASIAREWFDREGVVMVQDLMTPPSL